MSKRASVLLPNYIKPERYKIMIKPDLEGFTFYGEETIYLNLQKSAKEIVLHAKDITISSASLKSSKVQLTRYKLSYNKKAETVTIGFGKTIPKGNVELNLTFNGILNDQMRGFYRSKYFVGKKEKYMATTQFEPTDARRAFPCFDEPAQKAVFDVTLIIPPGTSAISNTLESSVVVEHNTGYKTVQFAPSPKMSTYLLAFIVGEFEYLEAYARLHKKADKSADYSGKGTLVRVFTTPGKKEQGRFALECAIKCLEFYNNYFDIPYPLPVLDLIAIPDFTSAAMENWGAITYRESALLVDPANTSASNKQWVAIVIAHEIAHQWFGNLVTMHWWTDLWLNEGFASYMENFCVDKVYPEFDVMSQFVSGRFESALRLDALKNTHPIEVEVHHPDEIGEIFDMISYAKGSAVIRMLAEYLGEKDFRDGLRHYLKKHSYGNTVTQDLWRSLEKISKKPVRKMMETWTKSAGYPLVRVIEEKKKLKLLQSRFFSSPVSAKETKDKTVWKIPIGLTSDGSRVTKYLLSSNQQLINKPKGWIKINAGETGFFRTDYPAQMLAALHSPIKSKKLSPNDRLGIIRDAFALAEAGHLPTTQALALAEAYVNEIEFPVWTEIAGGISTLRHLFHGQPYHKQFELFAQKVFEKIAKSTGFSKRVGEKHTQGLLRSLVLLQHGSFGDKATIGHFQKLFKDYLKTGKKIPPDIRGVVYYLAAENGGEKEFNFLIKSYKEEEMHEEQERIGRSLGAFKNKALLKKAWEFAMSDAVRFQDSPGICISMGRNPVGRELHWHMVQKHFKKLTDRYGRGGHLLEWFIVPLGKFNTLEKAKEVETFFQKHPVPGLSRTISQVVESIRSNAAWLTRDGEKVGKWLEENDKNK